MKKFLCVTLSIVILCGCVCLTACSGNALDDASRNADDYTIVCAWDDSAKVLSAVQTVEMTNRTENTFSAVKFHLFANAYREDAATGIVPISYAGVAYPNGKSYGDITIDCAKADGASVAFAIEGTDMDILSVPLEKELFPDQSVTVELTYTVKVANICHRLGWTEQTVNLGNFFPIVCHTENGEFCCTPYYNIGDPFVSDIANFEVSFTIDEAFLVAATGDLQEATSENNFVTYNYLAKGVRDFAIVAGKNFKKISQTVDDITVNYFYYADQESEASLATAAGALKYFCDNIGNYPYKQLSVCETEFCYGGMEYPQLVMVTSGQKNYREAIAHEVAHQWFYGMVGNNQIEHPWMDEGLAEFLTYLYLDHSGEVKLSQNVLANTQTYTTYVDVLNNYYNNVDTSFRSVYNFKNDNEYVVMTYIKGSLMFATLHETMGESRFWKALKCYFDQAQFTMAPPQLLIQTFEEVGGKEVGNILTTYIEGKEILGKVTD